MSQGTVFTDKRLLLEQYQRLREEGWKDDDIFGKISGRKGNFHITRELVNATFDPASDLLDQVTAAAFCSAFDIPAEDRGKLANFERKKRFLKLYETVHEQGYQGTRIREMVNEYCPIPATTFDDMVSRRKLNFNAVIAVAFCRTFGFDIDLILREGEAGEQKRPLLSVQSGGDTVDTRLPKGFEGRFYGYFFNSTPDYAQQGRLDRFTLDIGGREITMTLRHFALDSANGYAPREIALRGRIIHNQGGSSPSGVLAMAFNTEDDGSFCTLAYSKLRLNGPLHFRKGAMLIQSRGGDEPMPVMQSFVFTDKKIDLEIPSNRAILRGALALTGDAVLLEKEDLAAFMDSEALRGYFRKNPLEAAVRQYVELDEVDLRRLNVRDKDELYRVLLQMKANAAAPRLFRFPNSGTDRSWRCVSALGEEKAPRQQEGSWREQ